MQHQRQTASSAFDTWWVRGAGHSAFKQRVAAKYVLPREEAELAVAEAAKARVRREVGARERDAHVDEYRRSLG